LKDAEVGDFIAVLGDPELAPNDVTLWIVTAKPHVNPSGRWTAAVEPPEDVCKSLDALD
jgi:hypothetical protein